MHHALLLGAGSGSTHGCHCMQHPAFASSTRRTRPHCRYRFGSAAMALESPRFGVPGLGWLGVHSSWFGPQDLSSLHVRRLAGLAGAGAVFLVVGCAGGPFR